MQAKSFHSVFHWLKQAKFAYGRPVLHIWIKKQSLKNGQNWIENNHLVTLIYLYEGWSQIICCIFLSSDNLILQIY